MPGKRRAAGNITRFEDIKRKSPRTGIINADDPRYRSTKYGVNPCIPKPEDRPRCSAKRCCKPAAIISTLKDGTPNYRKVCALHHQKRIAARNGVSHAGELTAKRMGMTYTEYRNSHHPYRKHRLAYCENQDGRLGYACDSYIPWTGILQVDHIDGDPTNNRPDNLQTLCPNCHAYKTHVNKDTQTPGRKSKANKIRAMKEAA